MKSKVGVRDGGRGLIRKHVTIPRLDYLGGIYFPADGLEKGTFFVI